MAIWSTLEDLGTPLPTLKNWASLASPNTTLLIFCVCELNPCAAALEKLKRTTITLTIAFCSCCMNEVELITDTTKLDDGHTIKESIISAYTAREEVNESEPESMQVHQSTYLGIVSVCRV